MQGGSPASGREMTRLSPRGGWGQGSPRMWGFLHVHLFGSASHRSWPVYLSVPWWGWERPWRLHESFLAAAPRVPHPDWPMPVLQQFVQNSAGFFLTTFVASALKKKRCSSLGKDPQHNADNKLWHSYKFLVPSESSQSRDRWEPCPLCYLREKSRDWERKEHWLRLRVLTFRKARFKFSSDIENTRDKRVQGGHEKNTP